MEIQGVGGNTPLLNPICNLSYIWPQSFEIQRKTLNTVGQNCVATGNEEEVLNSIILANIHKLNITFWTYGHVH